MLTRRRALTLAGTASFAFTAGIASNTEQSPELAQFHGSFDAREWAKAFVSIIKANPSIPSDEETMTTWFANALMRGWDERRMELEAAASAAGMSVYKHHSIQELRGRVAGGWCSEKNSHKVMDTDLADAIVERLMDV